MTHPATNEYREACCDCDDLLKRIDAGLDKHKCKAAEGGLQWGHVGDLLDVIRQLKEVSDSLNHEGEYADEEPSRGFTAEDARECDDQREANLLDEEPSR